MDNCNNCKTKQVRYTHTLTVQRPKTDAEATVDDNGQVDLTSEANWYTVGRIRAKIITKGGSESHVFKITHADTTAVIKCPASSITRAMNPSWRLMLGDRIFNINTCFLINEIGRVYQIETIERRQA